MLTNLTLAAIVFMLDTNWGTTYVITPVAGYYDSTTFYLQTARVERVEFRVDSVKGVEKRREVDRDYVAEISTNIPPRLWPTNAPPSVLGNLQIILPRRRGDTSPIPIPPNPNPFRNFINNATP